MINNLGAELMLLGTDLKVRRQKLEKLDKRRMKPDDRVELQRICHKMDALRDDVHELLREMCRDA